MEERINTHGMIVDFGVHKDKLYTRMPVSYLKWMVQARHSKADIAKAELERRGTTTPVLDISGHAIDRASLRCRKIWHETALNSEEGLNSWLIRICREALEKEKPTEDGVVFYNNLKLAFDMGEWPVLKTIMPKRNKGEADESCEKEVDEVS